MGAKRLLPGGVHGRLTHRAGDLHGLRALVANTAQIPLAELL